MAYRAHRRSTAQSDANYRIVILARRAPRGARTPPCKLTTSPEAPVSVDSRSPGRGPQQQTPEEKFLGRKPDEVPFRTTT